jgi:hypothetical protein
MAQHRWDNVETVLYNDVWVEVEAHDTKGGQLSIFADDLEGGFWMIIRRDLSPREEAFLAEKYEHLSSEEMGELVTRLTEMMTGEMEPHYVMWYGFYEGHTEWRVDPLAIAWIFGLRSLEDLEAAFPGQLHTVLTVHHR